MTGTSNRGDARRTAGPVTAWAGWVVFGGFVLVLLGTFQIVQGLVALADDGFYAVTSDGLLVDVDYDVWGWVHLAIGVVAVLTGIGLFVGNTVARVVAVGIAALSALVNLAFLPAYPVWSALVVVLDVLVIYAVVVHGREVTHD
ncbi:DUF7144 family membrane protein [Blastococcus litoris]|uniref:DUF7144 family membrane protein n=1 Tax=Blastococcus litoris TaxID=2171622 RepID=UPI000E3076DD|nr:hypothetical protein [Blastococcus litoris]